MPGLEEELRTINFKLDRIWNYLEKRDKDKDMADFTAANAAAKTMGDNVTAQTPVAQAAATAIINAPANDQPQVDALTAAMTSAATSVAAATTTLQNALIPVLQAKV